MAKVYIKFSNGKERITDFGENVMDAFRYQSQFVRKSGVDIAQVIN